MTNIILKRLAVLVSLLLPLFVAPVNANIYEDAAAASTRPEQDRVRDAGRKPAEILQFFEVLPGQTVIDLSSGAGYYTRMLSDVVGPEGKVIAQNTARRTSDKKKAELEANYAPYGNIELTLADPAQLDMPDNSVDAVFLFLIVHHWHYNAASGDQTPESSKASYANILRILKPGGVFGIIDHLAPESFSRQDSAAIHRIPNEILKADITAAGFVLDAESDLLANHPEDDITIHWRDNTPSGQTQRLVQRYRKPE